MVTTDARLTVLYDADCAFCTWTARQIDRLDQGARMRLLPLQEAPDDRGAPHLAAVAATHPLPGALHAVAPDGAVHSGGDALIEIFRRLPGGALVSLWSRLPGARALAAGVYGVVAANRDALGRALSAAGASCEVPRRG